VVVLVKQLRTREVLNIVTQVEIDVVVVTELLNQIPVLETQFFRHIYRSGGVGLAHVFLQCLIHAVRIVISITPSQHPLCLRFKLRAPELGIFCVTLGKGSPRRSGFQSHNQYDGEIRLSRQGRGYASCWGES
jgi:hypothetical protein